MEHDEDTLAQRAEESHTRLGRLYRPFIISFWTVVNPIFSPFLNIWIRMKRARSKVLRVIGADSKVRCLEESLERVSGELAESRMQQAQSDAAWRKKEAQWNQQTAQWNQQTAQWDQQTTQWNQQWDQHRAQWNQRKARWDQKEQGYIGQLEQLRTSLADAQEREGRAVARTRELSGEITTLTVELRDAQAQHASLRDHLQLRDAREPEIIVADFLFIRRQIGKLCYDLTNAITEHIRAAFPDIQTSERATHFEELKEFLGSHSALALSSNGTGRPLEEFVESVLCTRFNESLYHHVLRRFHPMLDSEKEEFIQKMYEDVRATEPQAVSAKWRSVAFKSAALAIDPTYEKRWAHEFATAFKRDTVVALVQFIGGYWVDDMIPQKLFDAAVDIASRARMWHQDVQTNSLALDFRPILVGPGTQFSPEYMSLHEKHRLSTSHPSSHDVLASVGVGLYSSESFGAKKEMETELQLKVDVLTEGFFEQ
ncbi:hypothetical protein BOTBODRAFT_34502 [Botryobasidium botryosum FD-172 SS1]|uniref:Uncharacterized protein n=1 Tax=Botryobasidium botryosum (strain FD-172 SS1) TaxID=930990 RepID=A0A067MAE3_BOTB1|nr:hypothetical protein BOTBODRAFT_34502 [Botryobasidium botryosum FD-172 SS1]